MITGAALLLALTFSSEATAELNTSNRVIVAADLLRNAVDTSGHYGCRISLEVDESRGRDLWFTFGEVRPDAEGVWKTIGASSRCGGGTFAAIASNFTSRIGLPYLIADLRVAPARRESGDFDLAVKIAIRKLSALNRSGKPRYERSEQDRTLDVASATPLTLPLLIADDTETAALGVHEILVRLQAEKLTQQLAAAYGSVAVTADVPGARIFLDGGFAGRTSEGGPAALGNVLAGEREIRVVDLSGREASKQVAVKQGQAAAAAFDLLKLSSRASDKALVPIGANPQGYEEFWRLKDGAVVVRVPAGEFLMGSPEGPGQPHERPQHRVHVSEFLIDKTEVTWRQYRKFAAQTGASSPPMRSWGRADDYPVSSVTLEQASRFCAWAGGRLPTEAEWEKAARGPESLIYPWGNTWDPDRCNSWVGGTNRPAEVGSFPHCVSPYGVLDMAGNMWEWCADFYQEDYYATSPERDPTGPPSGRFHVQRGGDWISQPLFLRTAHRYRMTPTSEYQSNGIRCVQDPED